MDIKELKRELSKVSGIDFFSPKYRAIFKKYGGEENTAETEEDEAAKAGDIETDAAVVAKADEGVGSIAENPADGKSDQNPDYVDTDKVETEPAESIEENKIADKEDVAAEKETSEPAADITEETAEPETETVTEVATAEDAAIPVADMGDELLSTKLELELVRAGTREDRLETAKRLFMPEFKSSGGNIQQLRELIAQFPEWIGTQGVSQGFGMPLGDKADALTNEEKALKRMGINPRD